MVQLEQVFLPSAIMPDGRRLYKRVRDAHFVLSCADTKETSLVAQRPPTIACEDVPLDEARRISREPRMNLDLYHDHALTQNIQSLDNTATRITIPEGTSPTTMKNRILRVAAELRIPLTIRKVPGGLLFWRSTAEDLAQAKEVAQRLQPAQRKGQTRVSRHRRT
jgi:hypothetical protein